MRKASILLLSRLQRHRPKLLSPILSRNYVSSSPPPISDPTHLNRFNKTQPLFFKSHQFHHNPSRNLQTQSQDPAQLSSRQRKLEEDFESAKTSAEMLKAFKAMESSFDESDLAMAALKVGLKLDQEGENPNLALSFAEKAMKGLDVDENPNILVAMNLQLLGSVNYSLKKFNDSLAYLNRANRLLIKLGQMGSVEEDGIGPRDIRPVFHAVHLLLAKVKTGLGRREEGIENLKKTVEIKESILGKDSKQLGVAYRGVAEAYVGVLNFKEALPFCLKAVEIHLRHLGENSVEAARDRRILAVIYSGMEEQEKALEQNELSRRVLKSWGHSPDLLNLEIDAANMQIALGRFDEAIETLKTAILQTDKDSKTRAMLFITMSKALCSDDKFREAKICLEHARVILDKKATVSPVAIAEMYSEVATQYETMNELQSALSVLKKSQALLERVPQEQHTEANVSARIGYLLLLTGDVQEAIPYFESAAESLKECFGPKHYAVASVYNNLGAAYLELDRPQSAAQVFAVAKDIFDVSLGPHHVDSIEACQNVSKAYAAMESYSIAIEFQKKVIEAWERHGPSAEDQLEEAQQVLKDLKRSGLDEVRKRVLPLPSKSGEGDSE